MIARKAGWYLWLITGWDGPASKSHWFDRGKGRTLCGVSPSPATPSLIEEDETSRAGAMRCYKCARAVRRRDVAAYRLRAERRTRR
jgi:hypothetical protein